MFLMILTYLEGYLDAQYVAFKRMQMLLPL